MGMANIIGFAGGVGAQTLLAYDGGDDQDYARGFGETHELATRAIAMDLGMDIMVHAPAEPERFNIASSAVGVDAEETLAPEDDARHFVEDLIQLGRIDYGSARGIAPQIGDLPSEEAAEQTHVLEDTAEGQVLRRRHFDCGLGCCR